MSNRNPKYLVKFTDIKYDSIFENKVKSSFKYELNDTLELNVWLNPDIHPKEAQERINSANLNTQLCSVTSFHGCDEPNHINSISMWGHYSNAKNGIAIVYRYDDIERVFNKDNWCNEPFLVKCEYVSHDDFQPSSDYLIDNQFDFTCLKKFVGRKVKC